MMFVACSSDDDSKATSANGADLEKPSLPNSTADEDEPEVNAGGYDPSTGILTDGRDGQKYKTTKIGKQVWMAENLNYAYLQPTADRDTSSFCYDNDPANCKKYGRLYFWSAAMDSAGVLKNDGKGKGCGLGEICGYCGDRIDNIQGICPKGWHLPSDGEFYTLLRNVGSDEEDQSNNLQVSGWVNGVDRYGFSALPAGKYNNFIKNFDALGIIADFWASTDDCHNADRAHVLRIVTFVDDTGAYTGSSAASVLRSDNENGNSVRCIKD